MSLAILYSRAKVGIDAPLVTVEVHLAAGLPGFTIVGLPETSVREARERVKSAIQNSLFEFPAKKITVNLAPADLPKDGGRFDLAIALGILAASGQLASSQWPNLEVYGELALSGELRAIDGELPAVLAAKQASHHALLPIGNAAMAQLANHSALAYCHSLTNAVAILNGQPSLLPESTTPTATVAVPPLELRDVIGQSQAKRALIIAAAGGHNLLFLGPPGTGKSMLAQRLADLLPPMNEEQALATAAIHSIAGLAISKEQFFRRPFRAPHHTTSAVALVGGGSQVRPGEISLAHHGVLFLDEIAEYDRKVLDVLREPMETGEILIARAARHAIYPARFQLVAALNPSPTGHHQDGRCSPEQILRYLNRLSGPFLDRIDLQVEVPRVAQHELLAAEHRGLSTTQAQALISAAHQRQWQRQQCSNQQLANQQLLSVCQLADNELQFLGKTVEALKLSARSYHKILKVARTIADLDHAEIVTLAHIKEAVSYRAMDRLIQQLTR